MRKFLLMSKVTLFCLLCSFSLKSFSQALAASYAMRTKDGSQVESQSKSLKEALRDLELKHKIVFSYESKLIENKFVDVKNANSTSVEGELENLLQPLNLLGKKLDEKMYVIVPAHSKQINHLNKIEGTETETETKVAQENLQSLIGRSAISAMIADVPVKGKVTGEGGEALPGVSVVVKGTTVGTVTDASGHYSLNVPSESSVLSFSFIGYLTEEVTVGTKTTVDVTLNLDVKSLSEVVVTGYQTQSRREITGAVSSVSAKDLVSIPQSSVEQQLQGRVAGVSVITSGQPGTQSQVRIRGFGSFGQSSPLYVVDGVPTFDISFINPNDIETTTVLKDAATASQYGARASAGVILITTKRGKAGQTGLHVTYDGSYGVQNPGKGYDQLNPQQTMEVTQLALTNAGKEIKNDQYGTGTFSLPDYVLVGATSGVRGEPTQDQLKSYNVNFDKGNIYQIVKANKSGTDWFKELTDPAPIQNHTLAVSGSGENSRFYIGAGYFNQQGIVKNTWMKRYTLRANTEFNIKNRVRIGENFQVSLIDDPDFTSINGIGSRRNFNNLNEGNALSHAYRMNPLIPVYDINGGYAGTAAKGFNNPKNPIAIQDRAAFNRGNNIGSFGNIYASVDLFDGLTVRTSFGGRYIGIYGTQWSGREYENSENLGNNTFFEFSGYGYGWTWTNTLNYTKEFGMHKISALLGQEAIKDGYSRFINASGNDPLTTDPAYRTINTTLSGGRIVNSFGFAPTKLYSLFAKVDYMLSQKYLFGATVRRDASSNFSSSDRVGIFPAFSAGWIISEESFLQNVAFVNNLKVRGSWGVMGNQNAPLTNQFNLFNTNASFANYAIDGSNTGTKEGIYQASIANPKTKWESNKTFNIGFDGTFLNNTLEVIFDYYTKNTSNLLYAPALPSTLGAAVQPPTVNIGEISNKGVDFQIIKRGKIGSDFRYEADLTMTTYKNKIEKVADGVPYFNGPSNGSTRIGTPTRNQVGHSISQFYGYEVEGIFQSAEDVSSHATQADAAPGRFKFKDVDGDGEITDNDRTFIGNPNPDFSYGLTLKLGYKGFDFETTFFGVQGAEIFNYTKWFTDFYPSFPGAALSSRVLSDAWSETNKGGKAPIIEDASNFSTNQQINSFYVENGSYLRNRNMKLSYTLPLDMVKRVNAERFTVFIQGTNLFTATKYQGLDPGVSGVDTNYGVDYGNYPVVKQFILGVNIGF